MNKDANKLIQEMEDFKHDIDLKIKKTEIKINARVDDLEKVVHQHAEDIKRLNDGFKGKQSEQS